MTTMELEAQKAILAREILSIDDMELVKEVKKYLKYILAKANTKKEEAEEDLTPYTMEEINSWINQSEADIKAGRVYTAEEVEAEELKEMPWLAK